MGFCTKCGKQIPDGTICSCQQAPQFQQAPQYQQVAMPTQPMKAGVNPFVEYFNVLKGLFVSPAETVSGFATKANVVLISILIGATALVEMLLRLFNMLIANSKATPSYADLESILLGASVNYKPYSTGEIFKYMFYEILSVCVGAVVIALMVMLLVNLFYKAKISFVQSLSVFAVTCVVGIPASIISWVVALTDIKFFDMLANCVSTFSVTLFYLFVYFAVRAFCKDEKKVVLIVAITFVVQYFASWILGLMF